MASGHVNRTKRPNTWLHRPMLQREKALANSEPSTHGTRLTSPSDKSASGETADNKCSGRACPLLMLWTAPTLRHRCAKGWLR
jgi:hypothetical protein